MVECCNCSSVQIINKTANFYSIIFRFYLITLYFRPKSAGVLACVPGRLIVIGTSGLIPDPCGRVPDPTGLIPGPGGLVPDPTGLIPDPGGLVHDPGGLIPDPT